MMRMDSADLKSGPLNLIILILVAMTVCALIGAIIEFFAYRPMRNQTRIAALITAIGVSLLLQYSGQLFLPANPPPSIAMQVNPYQAPVTLQLVGAPPEINAAFEKAETEFLAAKQEDPTSERTMELERERNHLEGEVMANSVGITVTVGKIIMLVTVLVLMTILTWIVLKTSVGRAMRAASHDFDSASLMGINVNRVVTATFMIGSALAGAGAMMLATFEGTALTPFFGLQPGVKAFVAAVLGGIGNIPGAVLGGLLMGLAETIVVWLGYSNYKDAVAFVILIIVLLLRPGGLLGSNKVEKV
ncbi:branched-chain amino acid ABC transporter permease [Kamptonema cortianum]|nr:branched-chain amino acid ABC transporter permease [Geitlerinema splendidum]MDK3156236.1 branched-chain amino acid ABC transporter permease [Kamptonema cortianum]